MSARTSERGGAHGDRLVRLDDSQRILSKAECETILRRAHAFAQGGGDTTVDIDSWWQGELRWARNRVSLASDRRNIQVSITRRLANGATGAAATNQLDDISIEGAVRAAERESRGRSESMGLGSAYVPPMPPFDPPAAAIWSDATYGLTTESRAGIARSMIGPAEERGMLSAGYLEIRAATAYKLGTGMAGLRVREHLPWERPHVAWTQAQLSTTVRDPKGTASGWAGLSSYDWSRIAPAALGERALEKCIASQIPISLEPGRYTVILEPQAVADLMERLVGTLSLREEIEDYGRPSPWMLGPDETLGVMRTKVGLKVADERVTLGHDFTDPDLGIVAMPDEYPGPATWIDRGVLTRIGHFQETSLIALQGNHALRGPTGYRMSGGDTTAEEMIRTTKRGLLVTRFSNIRLLDPSSLLSTGLTRDGLWLIENGKITRAVKNLRFTESPLFVLNSLDQLGEPVRVFRPTKTTDGQLRPAIVPPLKARDFSFTSTIDAI